MIESIGGDATCQTPCADVAGVAAGALLRVLTDPRSTLSRSRHAILAGALIDRSGWEMQIALADAQGMDEAVARFEAALGDEREHLDLAQAWYAESMGLRDGEVVREQELSGTSTQAPGKHIWAPRQRPAGRRAAPESDRHAGPFRGHDSSFRQHYSAAPPRWRRR